MHAHMKPSIKVVNISITSQNFLLFPPDFFVVRTVNLRFTLLITFPMCDGYGLVDNSFYVVQQICRICLPCISETLYLFNSSPFPAPPQALANHHPPLGFSKFGCFRHLMQVGSYSVDLSDWFVSFSTVSSGFISVALGDRIFFSVRKGILLCVCLYIFMPIFITFSLVVLYQ